MWPFLRVNEKEFRGESPWRWFEIRSLPLTALVRSTVSSSCLFRRGEAESGRGASQRDWHVILALLSLALSPWAYALDFSTLRLRIWGVKEMPVPVCCVNQNNNKVISMKVVCEWKWWLKYKALFILRCHTLETAPFKSVTKSKPTLFVGGGVFGKEILY